MLSRKEISQALLLLALLPECLSAQRLPPERVRAGELPRRFILDVPKLRSDILASLPERPTLNKRMPIRKLWFADYTAFNISDRLTRGYVYSDWPDLEAYVNAVLQRVMPKDYPGRESTHAYIVRDGEFNAEMSGAGFMFINVGLFSELRDEASLAAVLCHELAHHHLDHAFDRFYQQVVLKEGEGVLGDFRTSSESVRREVQADSLAMVWMLASEYDLAAMHDVLRAIERIERQDGRRRRYRFHRQSDDSRTHPGAVERVAAFGEFYALHKEDSGGRFLESEGLFTGFKEACKSETLAALLDDMNYGRCIRLAFTYHLFDPEEAAYMWYLMEAVRRRCYLDSERWDEFFIMGDYTDQVRSPTSDGDEAPKHHLFSSFDVDVMAIDPVLLPRIQARFYWQGEVKFITNREAFSFFSQLAELLGCNECLLSAALECRNDSARSDSLLTRYLSHNGRYRAYAGDLLKDDSLHSQPSNKLLVFTGLRATIKQGSELIPAGAGVGEDAEQLQRLVDSLAALLPGRRVISLAAEKYQSLERNMLLRELWAFSSFSTLAKGERTQLRILDPRLHELFVKEGVNEIEFVSCDYTELRGKTASLDGYELAAEMDYNAVFNQTSGNRYLYTTVSCAREVAPSPIKYRHRGDEHVLKNGRRGLTEIAYNVKHIIEEKDERLRAAVLNWKK